MSIREKIIALLNGVPEYKMGYILAYVQGLTADEDADDAFCQQLYERYQNDPVMAMEAKRSRTRTRAGKLTLARVPLISHWTWE